jgi:tRNA nucleotidyltransferase/poly(A) polymerase
MPSLSDRALLRLRSLTLDPGLQRLLADLAAVGDVYLVGGALRDLLLGRSPADLDIVAAAEARQLAEAIAARLQGSAFALDEPRAQYRVVLPAGVPARHVDVSSFDTDLATDLAGRDFTVDAMAARIEPDGSLTELIDPFAGAADLERLQLRLVSDDALDTDPLRLLRGPRLATELGLMLTPETVQAIQARASLLPRSAPERQRDELARILAAPQAVAGVRLLDSLGLLEQLLPELAPARGVEQPGEFHYWDVFDHSIETLAALDALLAPDEGGLDGVARQLRRAFRDGFAWFPLDAYLSQPVGGQTRLVLLKLAGLLHDVAKPETKSRDANGRIRFFGHPELGATKLERIAQRLRFGSRETRFMALLVEEHLRPTQLSNRGLPSRRALYRFFRDLGEAAPACLLLCLADGAAAAGPRLRLDRWQGNIAYMNYVLGEGMRPELAPSGSNRLLSGDDLIAELGLTPGPLIGRLLVALDEETGAGELTSRDQALAFARELLSRWQEAGQP